jgi:hypothetical protein
MGIEAIFPRRRLSIPDSDSHSEISINRTTIENKNWRCSLRRETATSLIIRGYSPQKKVAGNA